MTDGWVKSTYSHANGNCLEWRKSSYSESGNCVEVSGQVEVRDSKNPDGPVLQFGGVSWGKFIAGVRDGPVS